MGLGRPAAQRISLPGEVQVAQALTVLAGCMLALKRERQVGAAGMLAGERPDCFTMKDQIIWRRALFVFIIPNSLGIGVCSKSVSVFHKFR